MFTERLKQIWSKPCPVCGKPMEMVQYVDDNFNYDEEPSYWICEEHNIRQLVTPAEYKRVMDEILVLAKRDGLRMRLIDHYGADRVKISKETGNSYVEFVCSKCGMKLITFHVIENNICRLCSV